MTTGTARESILSNPSPSNGAQGSDQAPPQKPAHAELRIPVQVAMTQSTRSARERIQNPRGGAESARGESFAHRRRTQIPRPRPEIRIALREAGRRRRCERIRFGGA